MRGNDGLGGVKGAAGDFAGINDGLIDRSEEQLLGRSCAIKRS